MRRVRNREACFHLTASQTVSLSSNKKIKLVEIFGTRNTWKHCIYCQEKCKSLNHSLSWHTSVGWAHNTNYLEHQTALPQHPVVSAKGSRCVGWAESCPRAKEDKVRVSRNRTSMPEELMI